MPEVFVSVHSKGHGHDEPIPPQKSSSEDSLRVHLSDEEENHLKHLLRPHCDSSDKISSLVSSISCNSCIMAHYFLSGVPERTENTCFRF